MKKLVLILALACTMTACNSTPKEEKSKVEIIAEKLVKATMDNDARAYYMIEQTDCKGLTDSEMEELKKEYDRIFEKEMRKSLGL